VKETPRPDPHAAAQRVKHLARDLASDLADGYRKSTRYVRMRAAVLGTWALLSAVTLWVACPSSGPTNPLGAEAQLLPDAAMGTQVMVANGSRELWTDVVLVLDDAWRYEKKTLRSEERMVVPTSRFTRDGRAAGSDLRPRTLTIQCEQGRATLALPAR
jgi:hypothetical protein